MFLHGSKNNGLPVNIPYTKLNVRTWHVTTICNTVLCIKLFKNFHNVNHVRTITNKQHFEYDIRRRRNSEIPVTIHLATVKIFQDDEAQSVMKNYNYLPKNRKNI
jgi:hypothetical protein